MKVLAIDASTTVASVALASENEIIAEYTMNHKKTHSQTLLPMIDEMMQSVGGQLKELDYVAVTKGPGSFTGLRIGAATAKGLTQALNIPIVAISSLEALAYNIIDSNKIICPIMDARRNNVFTAIYENKLNCFKTIMEDSAMGIDELVEKLNQLGEDVVFVGDGIKVNEEYIRENIKVNYELAPIHVREQKASSLVGRALEYINNGEYVASAEFAPDYLRKSQAERELEEKKKSN